MSKTNVIEKMKTLTGKWKSNTHYLQKTIAIKRLKKYANEIDMVLTKYNKKSCNETMMVKGPRKSCQETTNRKIHAEDLEKVVAQMAKGLGLDEDIVKIMGKHHDIGHTFFGHSGEWWISNILEDYGIGCFCHNTLGARELIYTHQVYDEIIEKIKIHNPKVTEKQLQKVRDSLWIIMDAINAHNGEKPEKEFIPQYSKTQEDFYQEMIRCYSIPGYDRKIMPATSEGCLMRLADKIAYTPLDMIDGLQEGMIRKKEGKQEQIIDYLDEDYKEILLELGITERDIEKANTKRDYTRIAESLKEIFIKDVVQNSTKHNIKMSKEVMLLMGKLINLNNQKTVDNVILQEDQETYPVAVRSLMNKMKDIILQNGLLDKLPTANENMHINQELEQYQYTPYKDFIQFLCNMNRDDYGFTRQIVVEGAKQSIKRELELARHCVQVRESYEDKEELGLSYNLKNARIKSYINYYKTQLESGNLIGYSDKDLEEETQKVMENITSGKQSPNYLSIKEQMAMMISAQYISTLNDVEFMQLIQDTQIIDEEKYKSLTRKYKDIPNLLDEVYIQKNWKVISTMQKRSTGQEK